MIPLEEAITVLFCLMDDAYAALKPDGEGYESLKRLSDSARHWRKRYRAGHEDRGQGDSLPPRLYGQPAIGSSSRQEKGIVGLRT
jgi:hypothetical protein